mmetsp:Transcript_12446/g.26869  ORF Transcript_12446/g.26869 Transcript_12446/m.26869 type:complete len:238 (-) Transcript_12446:380-1093(-)
MAHVLVGPHGQHPVIGAPQHASRRPQQQDVSPHHGSTVCCLTPHLPPGCCALLLHPAQLPVHTGHIHMHHVFSTRLCRMSAAEVTRPLAAGSCVVLPLLVLQHSPLRRLSRTCEGPFTVRCYCHKVGCPRHQYRQGVLEQQHIAVEVRDCVAVRQRSQDVAQAREAQEQLACMGYAVLPAGISTALWRLLEQQLVLVGHAAARGAPVCRTLCTKLCAHIIGPSVQMDDHKRTVQGAP